MKSPRIFHYSKLKYELHPLDVKRQRVRVAQALQRDMRREAWTNLAKQVYTSIRSVHVYRAFRFTAKRPVFHKPKDWKTIVIGILCFLLGVMMAKPASQVIPESGNPYKAPKPISTLKTPVLTAQATLDPIPVPPPVPVYVAPTPVVGCGSDPNMAFIYQHESGCRTDAVNPTSVAYGLCQALPGYKMATAGADWATSWTTQNAWCIGYADSRYGSPYLAMLAWQAQGWW